MKKIKIEKSNPLSRYYKEVSKYPQLSHEESNTLFQEYKVGNKSARQKLIQANLRLVISIANLYRQSSVPFEDIVQEGNIGLIKSIEKYDWSKGFRFSTYATWWIKQSIGQHILKRRKTVRLPVHVVGIQKKMYAAIDEYRKTFGVEPSTEELSELVGASYNIVRATSLNSRSTVSLTDPASSNHEDGDTIGDRIPDEHHYSNPFNALSQKENIEIARKSLRGLTKKENIIFRLRYGITEDVSNTEAFGMTKEEFENVKLRSRNQ